MKCPECKSTNTVTWKEKGSIGAFITYVKCLTCGFEGSSSWAVTHEEEEKNDTTID